MEVHYSLERDLAEARAMANGLEEYVRGGELYGSVDDGGMYSTDPNMPSLTLGAFLVRLRRLAWLEDRMTPEQKAVLTEIEAEHERVRTDWAYHYQGKLHNEAGARLHSLEAFFAECEDNRRACHDDYLPEALRRTMLEEIVDALHRYHMPLIDLNTSLQQRDTQLRRLTKRTTFIWDDRLRPVYPEAKFWWLYARPPVEEREEQRG